MEEPSPIQNIEQIEKELVAEQPGLPVSITGILLALFIGFAIRTALAPERIMGLVEKAAQKIDHRFKARVGTARVSLADGIFPEIAVVVKNLTLESEEACWMRPSIEVEELRLPIDMFRFFKGDIHIHEIIGSDVAISIRSEMSKCKAAEQVRDVAQAGSVQMAPTLAPIPKEKNAWDSFSRSRDSIDSVHFDRVRVHYLPLAFTSFEVKDLNISIDSKSPKKISSHGILVLAGETLSGDYASTANLKLNFDESEKPEWQMLVDGNWREGHYLLKTLYSPNEQTGSLNVDMNQIPLNQLFPLMRKYHLLRANYNAQQMWLSLKGEIAGSLIQPKSLPLKIQQVKIEGNIGEVESNNIEFSSLDPLKYKPIEVDIKALKVEGLLSFLNLSHPHPMLGKLGTFHGKAIFVDSQNIKIKGEHTGLEFVFANQMDRQLQKIGLIQTEMSVHPDRWIIKIDRIKPEEGVFLGHVQFETDANWKKQDIYAKIDELTLSPQVQKVMTSGGQLASFNGDLHINMENGLVSHLRGHAITSGLKIENILIKRSKVSFSTMNNLISMDWLAQGLVIAPDSEVFKLFKPVMQFEHLENSLEVPLVSAQLKTKLLQSLEWKNFNFNFEKSRFNSSGGWNEKGELDGSVNVAGSSKSHQYKIQGTRERPVFIEIKK